MLGIHSERRNTEPLLQHKLHSHNRKKEGSGLILQSFIFIYSFIYFGSPNLFILILGFSAVIFVFQIQLLLLFFREVCQFLFFFENALCWFKFISFRFLNFFFIRGICCVKDSKCINKVKQDRWLHGLTERCIESIRINLGDSCTVYIPLSHNVFIFYMGQYIGSHLSFFFFLASTTTIGFSPKVPISVGRQSAKLAFFFC